MRLAKDPAAVAGSGAGGGASSCLAAILARVSAARSSVVRVRGLSRVFGEGRTRRHVLDGLDLDVADGEMVAILGRSGSGKSTLLNVVGGLDRGYSGNVAVGGRVLVALSDAELAAFRNVTLGFVFQEVVLLEHLSCSDNVALPALLAPDTGSRAEIEARAVEALDRVGLLWASGRPPRDLSGGERQRVVLARALMMRPPLLLCDEPTGNLDAATGSEVVELLARVNGAGEATVVVATHDPAIAARADRVLRLDDGGLHEVAR